MNKWDLLFEKYGEFYIRPQEDIKKIIKLLKKEGVKKVLDLGCGSGRHTVMLAKAGFEVYGIDTSEEALKLARNWLKRLKLTAKLKKSSCYKKFPFKDNFFDTVISTQVIHHNYIDKVRFCISEIERVLKPNGILFVTVARNRKRRDKSKSKEVKARTYLTLEGREKGILHYTYTKNLMKKDFNNFKVIEMHIDKTNHHCLLGRLISS